MTGAWRGGFTFGNATSIGAVTGGSTGTSLVGNAATFTKGAWGQVIAATASDIDWVWIGGESITSAGTTFAVDIGIGAGGSEIAVVTNLNFSIQVGAGFFFPLTIPAGTRVAARFASNSGNDGFRILLQGFESTYQSVSTGSAIDTYGFLTTTNLGTAVDPGATPNTKGAYSAITASVSNDLAGFFIVLDIQNTSTGTIGTAQWLVDIAVGAGGSEIVILPNTYQIGYTIGQASIFMPAQHYYPIQIPSGSRIAARAQSTTGASPDRVLGVTLYGVRL